MRNITDCDFAIFLVSEGFLKSYQCMHEVHLHLQTNSWRKKTIVVVYDKSKIYNATTDVVAEYEKYWNCEVGKYSSTQQSIAQQRKKEALGCICTFLEYVNDNANKDFDDSMNDVELAIVY